MDRTIEWLAIAIAALVWAFFLLTPIGGVMLDAILDFYDRFI